MDYNNIGENTDIELSSNSEITWSANITSKFYVARITRCILISANGKQEERLRFNYEGVIPGEGKFCGRADLPFNASERQYRGEATWEFVEEIGIHHSAYVCLSEVGAGEFTGTWKESATNAMYDVEVSL